MVSLTEAQLPNHTHGLLGAGDLGEETTPRNHALAFTTARPYRTSGDSLVSMADAALPSAGGSQPHNNLQPFIAMNFIIALQGLYPSRG